MSLRLLLCLSSVLINLVATSSDVCKVVTAQNSIFQRGKRLTGFQFYQMTTVPDVIQCARNCFFRRRCLSFNYDENTEICEFNNARVDSPYAVLKAYADYLYSDIDDWDESIGMGPCWNRPCAICEACYPTEFNYTCVEEELTSCRDIKICKNDSLDDHYLIRPVMGTKPWLRIYCYKMTSNYPEDFLTLLQKNFSKYPPFSWNVCLKVDWNNKKVSFTSYQKIRLDVTDLSVNRSDVTFTTLSCDPSHFGISDHLSFKKSGSSCTNRLPYGVASDCLPYSCHPKKGEFLIDLRGTGLIVSPSVKWKPSGWTPAITSITRSASNEVIKGFCGGNCGGCIPTGLLILEPKS